MIIYSIAARHYEYNDEYYYSNDSYSNIVNSFTELKDAQNAFEKINKESFKEILVEGDLISYYDYDKKVTLTDSQEKKLFDLFKVKSFEGFKDNYINAFYSYPKKPIKFTEEQIDFLYEICDLEFYVIQESELLNIFA